MRNQQNQNPYHYQGNPYYQPNEFQHQMHQYYGPQYPYIQQNPFKINEQYQHQVHQQTFYPPNRPQTELGGMGPAFPYPTKKKMKKEHTNPTIMSQFKASDGNYDINKMLNTAGTMVNTMNQITGMVKQVGGFFLPK